MWYQHDGCPTHIHIHELQETLLYIGIVNRGYFDKIIYKFRVALNEVQKTNCKM